MRKKRFGVLIWAVGCVAVTLSAQRELTLNEAIAIARTKSVDAAVALNELKTAYWEYRTYLSLIHI